MKSSTRHIVLIILLLAAIGSYSIGFGRGIVILMALGLLFELAFWFGLFKNASKSDD